MRSIGFPELLVILGVAVLLFGGKKIPEVAKGLGISAFQHEYYCLQNIGTFDRLWNLVRLTGIDEH